MPIIPAQNNRQIANHRMSKSQSILVLILEKCKKKEKKENIHFSLFLVKYIIKIYILIKFSLLKFCIIEYFNLNLRILCFNKKKIKSLLFRNYAQCIKIV